MKIKIHWLYEGEQGYWRSSEGRYSISPNYGGWLSPMNYTLLDKHGSYSVQDTVAECKSLALSRCTTELLKEIG